MRDQGYSITTIESEEEFRQLRGAWNSLDSNFFLSWEWMYSWWESIGSRSSANQLCVIKVESEGKLMGLAPMYVERSKVLGRTLKFLAGGSTCSDMMRLPCRNGWEQRVAEAVLQSIDHPQFKKRFGTVDLIELEGHLQDEPTMQILAQLASKRGYENTQRELEGCWKVTLPSSWDSFRTMIKKSHRRKVNKVTKLLESGEFDVQFVQTPDELESAWPQFVALHQKRRQQLGQSGCFAKSSFHDFLNRATVRLISAGQGMLTLVRHQGHPVGSILCFRSGDCLCVYQSGLDSDLRQFEPGHFANTVTLQEAIRRGYGSLDFLRGDEPYKAGWGCERRALIRTRLVAPRFAAQVRHRVVEQSRQLRKWSTGLFKWSVECWNGGTVNV